MMRFGFSRRGVLLLLVYCLTLTVEAAEQPLQERWYRAAVNHVDAGLTVSILQATNKQYVRQIDLQTLGIPTPTQGSLRIEGERVYAASALHGYDLQIDKPAGYAHFIDRRKPHLDSPAASDDLLLTVTANGRSLAQPQYLRYEGGELWLPESTVEAMGIVPSRVGTPESAGEIPLHRVAGENFILDYRQLTLHATLLINVLETSRLNIADYHAERFSHEDGAAADPPVESGVAAFFDYQVSGGYDTRRDSWTSGFYEVSVSGGQTICQAEYLDPSDATFSLRRLTSSCVYDWPRQRASATVGDTIGGGGQLTQSVRFGGLQFGTNFELQPMLLTIPSIPLSGATDQPATLELWVDQALTLQTSLPPGRFELEGIPLRTGASEVRALVTSSTGEQQVLSYAFYTDSSLLADGLSDWSVNVGRLRQNYATSNDTYGTRFGAANFRHGLSDRFTAGISAQATRNFQLASVSAASTLGHFAALDTAVAASRDEKGLTGVAYSARLSHRSRFFNASYRVQRNSGDYSELAYLKAVNRPEFIRQFNAGVPLGRGFSMFYSKSERTFSDGVSLGFQTAGVGLRLGRYGSLRFSALVPEQGGDEVYTAHLSIPLGRTYSASASGSMGGSARRHEVALQKSLPAGPGFGYRVNYGKDDSMTTALADLRYQNSMGRVGLRGLKWGDYQSASANLSGSVVMSQAGINLTRRSSGSFAMIDVGSPDIPIYHSGQLKAYTDENGRALVYGLRPYEENVISIRAEDVPMNVQPQFMEVGLTPGRRELLTADFKFKQERYVTGELRLPNGQEIAAGSKVRLSGGATSLVGQGGEFFVVASGDNFEFDVMLPTGTCRAKGPVNVTEGSIVTDVGEIVCRTAGPQNEQVNFPG